MTISRSSYNQILSLFLDSTANKRRKHNQIVSYQHQLPFSRSIPLIQSNEMLIRSNCSTLDWKFTSIISQLHSDAQVTFSINWGMIVFGVTLMHTHLSLNLGLGTLDENILDYLIEGKLVHNGNETNLCLDELIPSASSLQCSPISSHLISKKI